MKSPLLSVMLAKISFALNATENALTFNLAGFTTSALKIMDVVKILVINASRSKFSNSRVNLTNS